MVLEAVRMNGLSRKFIWPEDCGKCGKEPVEMGILSKSGTSPDVFLCRPCAMEFCASIAMKSLSKNLETLMGGLRP